jgi:hypothetical protein
VRARNAAEDEYLAKLQAIRRQNYLEKKRIQEKIQLAGRDSVRDTPPSLPPPPTKHTPSPPPPPIKHTPSPLPPPTKHTPSPSQLTELEARKRKIAALKAQADQQAEHMRKVVEEKKRKRLAQQEAEAAKWEEPQGKEEGPRGKWAEPHELPPIAQQCGTTGSVTEGKKQVSRFCRKDNSHCLQKHHQLLCLSAPSPLQLGQLTSPWSLLDRSIANSGGWMRPLMCPYCKRGRGRLAPSALAV